MYKRNIETRLQKAIARSPIVFIKGPRQSGKTTLMKMLQGYNFISFDDIRTLQAATSDPMGFIDELKKPVIIDEVQRFPEFFLAIKYDIDRNRIPGRYILTGSADPLLMVKVADSLAGRVENLILYPLSQGELRGIEEKFVDYIWSDKPLNNLSCEKINQNDLLSTIVTGGYPSVQKMSEEDRYIMDLSNIEFVKEIPKLLFLYAERTGSLVNVSELSKDSGLNSATLNKYTALLEILFILVIQQAWHANLGKRLIKSPKSYFVDTGLLCWSQLLTVEKMIESLGNKKGHVIENFVVNELMKQMTWNQPFINLYHFR